MSLENIKKAESHQKLSDLTNSLFVEKFVFKSAVLKEKLKDIKSLSIEESTEVYKEIFAARYRTVHNVAIALNEFLDRSYGGIPFDLIKDVEWAGFVNATEEPIICLISAKTRLNLVEFLEAPSEGLIFLLCLGEGDKGKHFYVPMDDVLHSCDELVEFINMGVNLRVEDELLGIEKDFIRTECDEIEEIDIEEVENDEIQ